MKIWFLKDQTMNCTLIRCKIYHYKRAIQFIVVNYASFRFCLTLHKNPDKMVPDTSPQLKESQIVSNQFTNSLSFYNEKKYVGT